MGMFTRKHGDTYPKTAYTGDGTVRMMWVRLCVVHGELNLHKCDDWYTRHEFCNQPEQPAAVGLELPQAMSQAA